MRSNGQKIGTRNNEYAMEDCHYDYSSDHLFCFGELLRRVIQEVDFIVSRFD